MTKYLYVFLTIGLTVYGQIAIKARAMHHAASHEGSGFLLAMFLDLWVISGLIAALSASATWMLAIQHNDLSLVYPVMALTFVIVPILAVVMFGEVLKPVQILGLFLIVVGVGLSAIRT
jgi:drug/metabolite transporter (DMT)-like permease